LIIDYISDLHEDRDIFNLEITEKSISDFFGILKPKGEILIVGGDISDSNERLVKTLNLIQKLYYKKVFFVLGNHELYSFSNFSNYKEVVNDIKNRISNFENLILLDGDIFDYKGIKIGGTMMWYDGSYSKFIDKNKINFEEEFGIKKYDLNKIWELSMPDYGNIPNYLNFKEIFFEEKNKLKEIYKDVDILVTHISPLCAKKYVIPFFKDNILSSFFYFDGKDFIKNTSAKHWIFGHIHSELEVSMKNIEFHCNPYGVKRKGFIHNKKLKQIDI